jgi:hypothetical protein
MTDDQDHHVGVGEQRSSSGSEIRSPQNGSRWRMKRNKHLHVTIKPVDLISSSLLMNIIPRSLSSDR